MYDKKERNKNQRDRGGGRGHGREDRNFQNSSSNDEIIDTLAIQRGRGRQFSKRMSKKKKKELVRDTKSQIVCYKCDKFGHFAWEYRSNNMEQYNYITKTKEKGERTLPYTRHKKRNKDIGARQRVIIYMETNLSS